MKRRSPWGRAGHCFAFNPSDLLWALGFLVMVLVVPVLVVVTAVVTAVGLTFSSRPQVTVRTDAPGCPVCAGSLEEEEHVVCPRCGSVHHRDCWELNGGCTILGCARVPGVENRVEFGALQRRFRRWFWLTRVRWWSLLLFASVGAAGFLVAPLGLRALPVLTFILPALCLGGVSGGTWVLAVLARYRLDSAEYRLPSVPRWRWSSLLRRIEHSRSQPILERVVRWMPVVYGMGAIVVLAGVAVAGRDVAGLLWSTWALLCGGLFVWLAVWASRRHRVTLEQVRCRIRGAGVL